MSQTYAATKAIAMRYQRENKAGKGVILDGLCASTGWHRNHARKVLSRALQPHLAGPRRSRPPRYGEEVVLALGFCWEMLGAPTGKRLAPMMSDLVPKLRRCGELKISDHTAAQLVAMSPATIDRRLGAERAKLGQSKRRDNGLSSLFKGQVAIRSWDDAVPGFVEIQLSWHEGVSPFGDPFYTLTLTDIVTGWTESRSVQNLAARGVAGALDEIARVMPFPILRIRSGSGSECISGQLFDWCERRLVASTPLWQGHDSSSNAERESWADVSTVVDCHRYNTRSELRLLNQIWVQQSLLTNYFYPRQKLSSKVRVDGKVIKKHDQAATPHRRAVDHESVTIEDKYILADTYAELNPASLHRNIEALTGQLLVLAANSVRPIARHATPARTRETSEPATRAS